MSDRSGAAIPFVLLFSLALYTLAWSVLLSASVVLRSSRAAVTVAELGSEIQARLAREMTLGPKEFADTLPIGWTALRGDSLARRPWRADWTRLDAEAWLVRVTVWPGLIDLPGPPLSASRLAWALDPASRVLRMADITVRDSAIVAIPPRLPNVSTQSVGSIRLGLLNVGQVSKEMLPVTGALIPRVAERRGRCDLNVAENLGDPLGSSACRDAVSTRRLEGPVEVRGGSGHVVFAGWGDVTLSEGAHLRGLLMTEGMVRILDGTFEGLILAGQGLEVASGATFVAERDYARIALDHVRRAEASGRPLHPARNLDGR